MQECWGSCFCIFQCYFVISLRWLDALYICFSFNKEIKGCSLFCCLVRDTINIIIRFVCLFNAKSKMEECWPGRGKLRFGHTEIGLWSFDPSSYPYPRPAGTFVYLFSKYLFDFFTHVIVFFCVFFLYFVFVQVQNQIWLIQGIKVSLHLNKVKCTLFNIIILLFA